MRNQTWRSTLGMMLAVFAATATAQPYAAWSRYREVTIAPPANIAASLTNYPVLVRLSNAGIATGANVLSDALAGGADVRFTDSTGNTALAYEIDTWSSTRAAIWVRVPSIAPGTPTKIRLYWGNTSATSASNAGAVFDSASGFVGVWHLGNAAGISPRPNAITGAPPATPANDVDAFGGGAGTYVAPTGHIGGADSLRGAGTRAGPDVGSDYLNIGTPTGVGASNYVGLNTYTGYSNFTTGFTYSGWIKAATPQGNYTYLVELANLNGCNDNIQVFRPAVDARYRYEHCNGTTSGGTNQTTNGGLVEGVWQFVTVTMGTGSTPAYTGWLNGARQQGPTNRTQPISNVPRTNAWLGKSNYDVDYYWAGAFDEVRISRVPRDSNWIRMDYATQRADSSVVSLGSLSSAKALYYPQKNASYLVNSAITANVPVTSGALTGTFSISPSTLPAGLTFTAATGAISGTPTAITAATQYIVSATVGGSPASDTISIAVVGVAPGAPTGVTGAAGNAQVTVSWTAPSSVGTSAITSYLARATQDTTKSCTWTTGALSCVITGLTNGTAYTFVVRAANAAGNGSFSAASAAVTPATPPGAPTAVTAAQVGTSASVNVSWTAPASNGGSAITGYLARAVQDTAKTCVTTSLSCNVAGLSNGGSYTFVVRASNAAGNGAFSSPSASLVVGVMPGGAFPIQVSGYARSYRFRLTPKAVLSTEAFTMTISDVRGRTVWTRTARPASDGVKELVWDGRNLSGQLASSGVYIVKVTLLSDGQAADFVQKAVQDK